tara:strand:- start:1610 stop:2755 length:1146 start_codon:yes stop_codon:yes gene_type:complete
MQEGNLHQWFKGSKSKDGKSGWVNVVTGGTCASDEPGEGTPKCVSSSKRASMTPAERRSAARRKKAADPNQQSKSGAAKPTYVSTDKPKKKMKEEMEINEADKKGKGSGKKDACYHKVKASAKVWPSAYASGRLVQCRKKGAANYGKSKNEEFLALPEFTELQINSMRNAGIEVEVLDEKCWVGYTQKGMKKKGNKMVPNCVPVGEETKEKEETIEEATRVPAQNGNVYLVGFTWRGKYMMMKIFFPEVRKPARSEVQDALEKVYPGSFVKHFYLAPYDPSEPMLNVGVKEEVEIEEDWQKVNKSDKTDGMSKKAVAAYRRENPGSKLKTAVTGDPKPGSKDAKRRKSYCSRSAGQQKMHNIDCSKTPDKAICKARRRWKC